MVERREDGKGQELGYKTIDMVVTAWDIREVKRPRGQRGDQHAMLRATEYRRARLSANHRLYKTLRASSSISSLSFFFGFFSSFLLLSALKNH